MTHPTPHFRALTTGLLACAAALLLTACERRTPPLPPAPPLQPSPAKPPVPKVTQSAQGVNSANAALPLNAATPSTTARR